MNGAYFRFPAAAYEALRDGDLSLLQYTILGTLYYRANWKTGVVRSISADQVIRDLGETGLLPTDSVMDSRRRLIQRAMKAMRMAGWFTSDYKEGSKRPYNIQLTNYLSLSVPESVAADNVADNDADEVILNPCEITSCAQPSLEFDADNVADVSLTCRGRVADVSPNNQYSPTPEKEIPLNPPSGDFSPSVPFGETLAAGLSKPAQANPADRKRLLHDVAVMYANFSLWLSSNNFSPEVDHIEALLQDFHPTEILYAYVLRFEPWKSEKYKTTEQAQFFRRAARTSIEAARLQPPATPKWFHGEHFHSGNSKSINRTGFIDKPDSQNATKQNRADLRKQWTLVVAAWNKYKEVQP